MSYAKREQVSLVRRRARRESHVSRRFRIKPNLRSVKLLALWTVDHKPRFREPAKADWLGFDASRYCTSRLGTFEQDSTHGLLLFDM